MSSDRLPSKLLRRVEPADVDRYARSAGWHRVNGFDERQLTVYERPDLELRQLLVPASQVDDYEQALTDVIGKLAEIEQRPALEVLTDLLISPADVLRVGVTGPETDPGLLSIAAFASLLAGLRQALLAAACSVLTPREYHPRLRLSEAEQFLDACGVVPSEPGGCVLALACPLDAVSTAGNGKEPFARRVTGLLMRSIHRLAEMVDAGQIRALLQSPDVRLFSGNLCEALLLMRPAGNRSSLACRATWAPSGSACPTTLPASAVHLGQDHFEAIEQLALRLRPKAGERRQLFVGFVEVLRGVADMDDRPAGEVIVSILRDDEAVAVRLQLDADDYEVAGHAHLQHQPVRFEGVLHRSPRLNRVDAVTGFAGVAKPVAASAG